MLNCQSLLIACLVTSSAEEAKKPVPWSDADRKKLVAEEESLTKRIEKAPKDEHFHSQRGDVRFFLGRFEKAVADYEKTVELRPSLEASHWRRGIAYFYAGEYKKAAHQFEIYHSFDNVDRENGIWRYLSQFKAHGRKKAREGLLKYEKDDREPFPDVYKLFSGDITDPKKIIERIEIAEFIDAEREKRLFYAHLYCGLNEAIEGRDKTALEHLRAATNNRWGQKAGGGPKYMWHVGRVHHERLRKKLEQKRKPDSKRASDPESTSDVTGRRRGCD